MSQPPTVLLLGSAGQLGRELVAPLRAWANVVTSARGPSCHGDKPGQNGLSHVACDLADPDALAHLLQTTSPDHVVNASAFTAVDLAESQTEHALAVNAGVPDILSRYMQGQPGWLVHYSTDYVFPGNGTAPYRETDPTAPINAYGASKLAGEEALRGSGCRYLIFRTGWVYGRYGSNFVKTITRLATQRELLTIVDDQVGRPTCAAHLAVSSVQALMTAQEQQITGTFHLSATGEPVTWYGFAQRFLSWFQHQFPDQRLAELKPVSTAQFPTPARRPGFSVLSNRAFEQQFGLPVADWQTQLTDCLPSFDWSEIRE